MTSLAGATASYHPKRGDKGEKILLKKPSLPSTPDTWLNPDMAATFVPGSEVPSEIAGIPLAPWLDVPRTEAEWQAVAGIKTDLVEPPLQGLAGKKASSGVVIEEADGRVWLIAPSNQFGGYKASFPKGTADPKLSLQATAIKEAFEETGLRVEITGLIGDFPRTTSVARMYRARRLGGTPGAMGWESQAVHLVPKAKLLDFLNMPADHALAKILLAG
ncbi:NUDIX hydrolase [Kaistia terrae]|uniref:NUDIX hydrolase n=1 Tax=Kaistia terrae TaxID=537017 RepID=A0ABW0Q1G3_9HYPH|nr:NUDIX hydrolase [Kaistia terrae]MCX5579480.1 NUDIX hydrolase [Kaistia terrae]